MTVENRRGFYRIPYPPDARPRLLVDAHGPAHLVYEVIECSERGLRIQVRDNWAPLPGSPLAGTMHFARGGEAYVAGTVTRVQGDEVAVALTRRPLALSDILAEQLYLRGRTE